MTNLYTSAGVIVGSILIVTRIVTSMRTNSTQKPLSLSDAMAIIFSCVAIGTAIQLGVISFQSGEVKIDGTQKLYIFIGGLALLWVSVESVVKIFKPPSGPNK